MTVICLDGITSLVLREMSVMFIDRIEWNRVEAWLVRVMPRLLVVIFLLVAAAVMMNPISNAVPYAATLNIVVASIVPLALGFPLYAIRLRHEQITRDPYEEPFGDIAHLPHRFHPRKR